MGTRMVSAAESPVHANYKNLIVDTPDTGTVFLNRFHKPGFRVLATPYSEAREETLEQVPMAGLDALLELYFNGDLDASFAFGGQVAGRIDEVRPVQEIIEETIAEFHDTVSELAARYPLERPSGG
jgi:enoyl-[acyl-carrier protein] reductase II